MSESKLITTQTTLNVVGSTITITTAYFNENLSGVVLAFISETIGGEIVDSVSFIEGEGGITIEPGYYPSLLDFSKNSNGELIVVAPDSAQFSIDSSTGQLVYTY